MAETDGEIGNDLDLLGQALDRIAGEPVAYVLPGEGGGAYLFRQLAAAGPAADGVRSSVRRDG